MDDVLRELLHASIYWRHTRTMIDEWKREADDDARIPNTILDSLADATTRLRAASLAAERVHGPEGQ